MHYRARAPLRVDFAGGWTDVPLYAEAEGGAVVNAAITLYATGHIVRPEGGARPRLFGGGRSSVSYQVDAPPSAGLGASAAQTVLWVTLVIARNQPWAPFAVSGVLLATIAPELLIAPFAGVFADRWNKRHTMLVMDAARALLIAPLILVSGAVFVPFLPGGRLPVLWQLGLIYGIVFLVSACSQFFNPSMFALIAAMPA